MKIVWLDPVNSDAQFFNLLCIILGAEGHQVVVRSNRRAAFPPPPEVEWVPFSTRRSFPTTLKKRPAARLWIGASYPFDWLRAARWARGAGVGSLLFSSSLALPRFDAWGLRRLKRSGLRPVVLVHRPYLNWSEKPEDAARYRSFYQEASRLLVMSQYSRELLVSRFGLAAERIGCFAHPHFQPLLDRCAVDGELRARLEQWAQGAPVISFLANMTEEHGMDTLLAALPELKERLADFRLLIVSRLSDRDQEKASRVEEGLRCQGVRARCWCHWASYSYPALKAYLEVSTVVVAPYRWATQSGVVAMATGMGIPVVGTAVGGLPEMICPGLNGELVPEGDGAALARALVQVVEGIEGYRRRTLEHRDEVLAPRRAAAAVVEALGAGG